MEGPGVDCMQNSKGGYNESMTFTTLHGQCFGLEFEAVDSNGRISEEKPGSEKSNFSITKSDSKKSLVTVYDLRRDGNLKDGSLYDFNLLPSEKSQSGGNLSFEPVDTGLEERADVTLLKDRRREVTELDVERVIEEQDTHDLYCPNCNSCITKRVILRKRKRKIQSIHYDGKREKIDTVVNLDGSSSAFVINDESREVAESVLESSPAPPVNDRDHDTGPDIFRCLSCFTVFIPTASGFKLFRIFGDRGERENIQILEQIPVRNVNWFFSLFESIRRKKTAEQVDVVTHCAEVDADALRQSECLPDTLPSQQMDHLSNQGTGFQHVGANYCFSPNEKPASEFNQNVTTDFGEKQDASLEKISNGSQDSEFTYANTMSVLSSKFVAVKESHVNEKSNFSNGEFQKDLDNVNMAFLQGAVLSAETQSDIARNDGVTKKTNRVDGMTQFGEDEALGQSKWLPETLSVQQMHHLSNQAGRSPDNNTMSVLPPKFVTVEESHVSERVKVSAGEFQKDVHQVTTTSVQGAVGLAGSRSVRVDDVAVPIHTDQDMHGVDSAVPGRDHGWDVLKSIIYGGLIESITNLGIVSSAASSAATTLNIVILGLANLMSGLIIIIHNIRELKNDYQGATSEANLNIDRYQEALGRREDFRLHAIVAVLSYIVFGLLPPVTYGFSFRRSDDKSYKLITCGAASLLCIILLSIGKAHVQRPPKSYVKTVLYYLLIGLTSSGLCYALGLLIKRLLENSGWFETILAPSTAFLETRTMKSGWEFYA